MDRRDFSSRRGAVQFCLVLLAAGCSPTFNWRDTPMPDAELTALLPCKPDRAERAVPLGGESVPIRMAGCEAGGATFAVAQARAADVAQATAWLAAWRASTRAQWQAASGGRVVEAPATVLHASASPAPWQLEVSSPGPDGKPTEARIRWFAHVQRDGSVAVYQATVLGRPSAADAVATFYDGLRLP